MQEENHIFQGLKRDNHQIKQESGFLWDAHNIRITDRDDNTLLSITNERGTLDTGVELKECYVGHCVLGKYLVVFTGSDENNNNYIYRIERTKEGYKTVILYYAEFPEMEIVNGKPLAGGWSPYYPIETMGNYETDLIQKVYWVDGIHQPRVINIAYPELKGIVPEDNEDLTEKLGYTSTSFNFVSTLDLGERVDVTKLYGSGMFSPGTIQYAFSYYNKYGQESNIFYTTPLYYISQQDRGGNPEEKISNSFRLEIWGAEYNKFDYIRIYSIHRTSIDAVPTVKIIGDVECRREDPGEQVSFIDTGTTGSTIDPAQLLYIGGKSIIPQCLTSKDGTLFLGNISLIENNIVDAETLIKHDHHLITEEQITLVSHSDSYYEYEPKLDLNNAFFKSKEVYRCGVQLQYLNGEWSEPIYLDDLVLNPTYPNINSDSITKTLTRVVLGNNIVDELYKMGYRKVRTCIVFPTINDRSIICQGVLNPTVYNVKQRCDRSPFSNASWFFRSAYLQDYRPNQVPLNKGVNIAFAHNEPLISLDYEERGVEIQGTSYIKPDEISNDPDTLNKYGRNYFVDENIVTFNSPDIEFDTSLFNLDWNTSRLNIIGVVSLGAIIGDIDVQTSTPKANDLAQGFIHDQFGYTQEYTTKNNGGIVASTVYNDSIIQKGGDGKYSNGVLGFHLVYPWHRSGSLNNDENRTEGNGTRSAVLSKKKISNLKFFSESMALTASLPYNISTPQFFQSNEVSLLKVKSSYLNADLPYYGNVDTMLTGDKYEFWYASSIHDRTLKTLSEANSDIKNAIANTSDAVRVKYKSTPHLVFSLIDDSDKIRLLPRYKNLSNLNDEKTTLPDWFSDQISSSKGYVGVYKHIVNYKPNSSDRRVLSSYSTTGYSSYVFAQSNSVSGAFRVGKAILDSSNKGSFVELPDKSVVLLKLEPGTDVKCVESSHSPYFRYFKFPNTSDDDYTIEYRIQDTHTPKYRVEISYNGGEIIVDLGCMGRDVEFASATYTGETKYYRVTCDYKNKLGISMSEISASEYGEDEDTDTDSSFTYKQDSFDVVGDLTSPYLLLAEIVKDIDPNIRFGGKTKEALRNNLWIPSGDPVLLVPKKDATCDYQYGDTWYSRYDCLKTYPFTQEDENQIVEIGSFMCETRVNIDGRYDRNRGQLSNLNMTPQNFNLLNEVYSQKDNFFNYRILDEYYHKQDAFVNQVTWSKEKSAGEEIDTWTNITLANTLDMNGEKGKVTALKVWNENLLCFQEKALSQILFNSRAQIPVSDGVPIEISNGYKVDGSRILGEGVGCNNKWSIMPTTTGVYFIDSNTNSIYVFNSQLFNLSADKGMSWWVKQSYPNREWYSLIPEETITINGVRTFYDGKYGDIYFTPGPVNTEGVKQSDALCYSEKLGQFISLMSYGGAQAMFNFAEGFYSLKGEGNVTKLYQNNMGDYNNFFGEVKPYSLSFISNQNSTLTKIFDTTEFRADMYDAEDNLLKEFPFSYIEASNEYQKSNTCVFSENPRTLRKKFRVWRANIPRASKVASRLYNDSDIIRNTFARARMRNPWTMITLGWNPDTAEGADNNKKAVIHDISVKYTV